ncbi:DUF6691 family protein [Ostreiculturibacter nitratireducens]|uniref:DUF6691 family protein n=1 Tax=Ostreiculturibacter nitratireducens TaxID=3075226 RepID=UPI0031B645FA
MTRRNLFAALSCGLFGAGLTVSGMIDTVKVQGWLDIFGDWNPTLAFVLGGAMLPMAIAWRHAAKRTASVLGTPLPERPAPRLGHNLVLGSFLFGGGWGLAGLSPGPSLASAAFGGTGGIIFLLSMIAGMFAAPAMRTRIDRIAEA